jgi:hypothetical protein
MNYMRYNLTTINPTEFEIKDCSFGGDPAIWVSPRMEGTEWTEENLVLRSSIWRKSDGELISAGFKKFFNWDEKPNIQPPPTKLHSHVKCVEKIDGSCLILTNYKGEIIKRTRRALSKFQPNGQEVEDLLTVKYPALLDHIKKQGEGYSFILEWVTPTNLIVLNYDEPDLYLTGIIKHDDYSYLSQYQCDLLAKTLKLNRPLYYEYPSIETMLDSIQGITQQEGICVYYDKEQCIRKLKSEWYRTRHSIKSHISLKNTLELFLVNRHLSYDDFCKLALELFKFEGMAVAQPFIDQVYKAKAEMDKTFDTFLQFGLSLMHLPTKKEKAEAVFNKYGMGLESGIVLALMDGKGPDTKAIRRILTKLLDPC